MKDKAYQPTVNFMFSYLMKEMNNHPTNLEMTVLHGDSGPELLLQFRSYSYSYLTVSNIKVFLCGAEAEPLPCMQWSQA